MPLIDRRINDGAAAPDTDIVVEEIEPAELLDRRIDETLALDLIGDIGNKWRRDTPSAAIIDTVCSAASRTMSTTITLAPERASSNAAARPFPIPSSGAPPPVTIATLPARPRSSSGRKSLLMSILLLSSGRPTEVQPPPFSRAGAHA